MADTVTTATGLLKTGIPDHPSLEVGVKHSTRLVFSIMLASVAFLCGCKTASKSLFSAAGFTWHVQEGQVLWRPKNGLPEIGGDLVFASDNAGHYLIQFDKTPIAILSAQITTNRWLIRFSQRQMSFGGYGQGSTRFSWLYLPAALAGKPLPKQFHFENQPDGGWRLENTRTGESLKGFLSP